MEDHTEEDQTRSSMNSVSSDQCGLVAVFPYQICTVILIALLILYGCTPFLGTRVLYPAGTAVGTRVVKRTRACKPLARTPPRPRACMQRSGCGSLRLAAQRSSSSDGQRGAEQLGGCGAKRRQGVLDSTRQPPAARPRRTRRSCPWCTSRHVSP